MQNFTPAYTKGWAYVRTILSEPKFLGCMITRFSHPWCSAIRYCNAMNVRARPFHFSFVALFCSCFETIINVIGEHSKYWKSLKIIGE